MLFERVTSEGLTQFSYIIGHNNRAVVIDPRRDCDIYLKICSAKGYRISHILETHRNEDYLVGSRELAHLSGAEIWHADSQLAYRYGKPVHEGQYWRVGKYTLESIHTPGHTPGHMSYLLRDAGGNPWMVFTGDALFAGDTGRVDLMGEEKLTAMASLLYETLFDKLLPLGDQVIVCPAHGQGSVCGSSISARPWTTIGLERRTNPMLQFDSREQFIQRAAIKQERPPYFTLMEEKNLEGAAFLSTMTVPPALEPGEFAEIAEAADVLDTRSVAAFGAAHIHSAISMWPGGVSSFAGWFLQPRKPLLIVHGEDDISPISLQLYRMGFDSIAGYLAGGILGWHRSGRNSEATRTVTVQDLCSSLDENEPAWILDVRSEEELEQEGTIPNAHHLHLTQLPQHMDSIPRTSPVYVFCGSGLRSMIVASLLQRNGWSNLSVVMGGVAGWNAVSCPLGREQREEEVLAGG